MVADKENPIVRIRTLLPVPFHPGNVPCIPANVADGHACVSADRARLRVPCYIYVFIVIIHPIGLDAGLRRSIIGLV